MANSPYGQYFASIVGQFKNFKMQFSLGILFLGRCMMPSLVLELICDLSHLVQSAGFVVEVWGNVTVWHPDRSELRLHRGLLPGHFSFRLFLPKCFKLPAQKSYIMQYIHALHVSLLWGITCIFYIWQF